MHLVKLLPMNEMLEVITIKKFILQPNSQNWACIIKQIWSWWVVNWAFHKRASSIKSSVARPGNHLF